ncbi:MAG: TRAP transporter small permease, partial [Bacteroidetes bacterium]|nr:TRAP transporter small permease [Bacteroidota bacterium]
DVLARNLRLGNMAWANEVAEYTLYLSTFLAAPWLLRQGAHVRMDVVLKMLPTNLAWALEVLADIFAILACSALTFACGKAALASAEQGSLVFKIFIFPEWWLITPASVLFGFLTVECVLRLLRQINSPKTIRSEATSSV